MFNALERRKKPTGKREPNFPRRYLALSYVTITAGGMHKSYMHSRSLGMCKGVVLTIIIGEVLTLDSLHLIQLCIIVRFPEFILLLSYYTPLV